MHKMVEQEDRIEVIISNAVIQHNWKQIRKNSISAWCEALYSFPCKGMLHNKKQLQRWNYTKIFFFHN